MKILILGGSGFIGRNVANVLSKNGHKVTIFDKNKNKNLNKNEKFILGDIRNFNSLGKAINGKDIVYNFAALSDIDQARLKPSQTIILNILAVSNILNLCKSKKVKKIYSSKFNLCC